MIKFVITSLFIFLPQNVIAQTNSAVTTTEINELGVIVSDSYDILNSNFTAENIQRLGVGLRIGASKDGYYDGSPISSSIRLSGELARTVTQEREGEYYGNFEIIFGLSTRKSDITTISTEGGVRVEETEFGKRLTVFIPLIFFPARVANNDRIELFFYPTYGEMELKDFPIAEATASNKISGAGIDVGGNLRVDENLVLSTRFSVLGGSPVKHENDWLRSVSESGEVTYELQNNGYVLDGSAKKYSLGVTFQAVDGLQFNLVGSRQSLAHTFTPLTNAPIPFDSEGQPMPSEGDLDSERIESFSMTGYRLSLSLSLRVF